jgi:membrane protein insertase Oxa1/YidC/SpoIIIJ
MPIWIALWSALNTTFELRQAPFLWGFTWIKDLAPPDALIDFGRTFDLLRAVLSVAEPAADPAGGRLLPPAGVHPQAARDHAGAGTAAEDDEVDVAAVPGFPLPTPSGLCLYIFTSTSIGIIESKRIRRTSSRRKRKRRPARSSSTRPGA